MYSGPGYLGLEDVVATLCWIITMKGLFKKKKKKNHVKKDSYKKKENGRNVEGTTLPNLSSLDERIANFCKL